MRTVSGVTARRAGHNNDDDDLPDGIPVDARVRGDRHAHARGRVAMARGGHRAGRRVRRAAGPDGHRHGDLPRHHYRHLERQPEGRAAHARTGFRLARARARVARARSAHRDGDPVAAGRRRVRRRVRPERRGRMRVRHADLSAVLLRHGDERRALRRRVLCREARIGRMGAQAARRVVRVRGRGDRHARVGGAACRAAAGRAVAPAALCGAGGRDRRRAVRDASRRAACEGRPVCGVHAARADVGRRAARACVADARCRLGAAGAHAAHARVPVRLRDRELRARADQLCGAAFPVARAVRDGLSVRAAAARAGDPAPARDRRAGRDRRRRLRNATAQHARRIRARPVAVPALPVLLGMTRPGGAPPGQRFITTFSACPDR
ncbi:hypothetical protein BDI4_760009 [Burkholderia diffusa]|nr:hypothetical protein BDI4_760009 [Burkholderia diffusa]